jgi:hypothetical protein
MNFLGNIIVGKTQSAPLSTSNLYTMLADIWEKNNIGSIQHPVNYIYEHRIWQLWEMISPGFAIPFGQINRWFHAT